MSAPHPLHADALAVLRSWTPPAPGGAGEAPGVQSGLRAELVEHLEREPGGMWRSCYPDHLTAGAIVVDARGERALLNLHRKAQRWFAFGGHAEEVDVTLSGVARREAREESGIDDLVLHPEPLQLDVHEVPFCDPRGGVRHLDVRYGAVAPLDAREVTSEESLAVRWWPIDALPELEPAMVTLIHRTRDTLC